jgi:hypothetical protein
LIADLKKTIAKQTYRHDLFPTLLLVVQELDTWEARAAAFNAVGLKTYSGKPWTKGNLHALYQSYWAENGGSYSHLRHAEQLEQLEQLVA